MCLQNVCCIRRQHYHHACPHLPLVIRAKRFMTFHTKDLVHVSIRLKTVMIIEITGSVVVHACCATRGPSCIECFAAEVLMYEAMQFSDCTALLHR